MTGHSTFLQRPDYAALIQLSDPGLLANQRQAKGYYDITSLWLFKLEYRRKPCINSFIGYLQFRRSLGYPIKQNQREKLECFIKATLLSPLWTLGLTHRSRLYLNLIQHLTDRSGKGVSFRSRRSVKHWQLQQQNWLTELKSRLAECKTIAIVGNSPGLRNAEYGTEIDAADFVVRFNLYNSTQTRLEDIGNKLSLWVVAPGYRGPAALSEFCLVSGPDMLFWRQNWDSLLTLDSKVLSSPLCIWRSLVRKLAAPPSAGLLCIEFLKSLCGEQQCLKVFGFGYNPESNTSYHHTSSQHQAVNRHNWNGERQLLNQWSQQRINVVK